MLINEMNERECSELLSRSSMGRLGCALENQPYVVPIGFAHEGSDIYVLSTLGQKVEWMRQNPKVCVQVDEILSEKRWASVIVTGLYGELREPQFTDERERAKKLLEKRYHWWEAPIAERQMKSGSDLITPLLFRIRIDSMTGLRAIPEQET